MNMKTTTVIIPDESQCTSSLGKLLYSGRKIYGFYPIIADVKEIPGIFGYMEYTINIRASPHHSLNYDIRNFKIASRFRDLHRLHGQLNLVHKQLHLKNTFPGFVEPKIFYSKSPETITERRLAIETFLNFVLKNDVLSKARVFQAFIENAKEDNTETKSDSSNQENSEPSLKLWTAGNSADSERKTSKTTAELTKSSNGECKATADLVGNATPECVIVKD